MDTSWWPGVLAVIALALVAAVVDGRGRSRRPARRGRRGPGRARPAQRPPRRGRRTTGERGSGGAARPGTAARPAPGEIWWARVPYEDAPAGAGAKDRPCLVLSVRGGTALVIKITSRHHDERPGVIPLPPGTVGDTQGRPSYLETDELREVTADAFRRRAGVADPLLWDRVRHLGGQRRRRAGP
ncbi:type II toxin-antitoxin system PemK/MazF family toxin [Streptomyces pinistramenti]|uniref:type II toxin-antitoxin system PemK/MazF family toxin n=1 Tax=Streptomyces pinistramenti TaxID=2884812 RepID=UPI001D05EC5A|nr:type II toxin-antitoxin system PemK/MazF family toxin [Streptomyces pinistramenti]MCB5911860.1 type II toxin-antitoxin system PemK/MazF family toxin [Streptomyces pinistramenti]